MRGISLDEIMATTKISRRLLQALEDEQFELLPGGIFNKSYVRSYAKCVGINEDEAVVEYLQAAKETLPDTRVIAHQHASLHSDRRPERSAFPFMPVLVLLVVAAGSLGGWKVYRDRQRGRDQQMPRAASVEQGAPAAMPGNTTGATSGPQPAPQGEPPAPRPSQPQMAATGNASLRTTAIPPVSSTPAPPPAESAAGAQAGASIPFEVTVTPKDSAWVSIKADGNYVVRGIIKLGDVKTIHAHEQVVFYTGNAGAVEVAFDGKNVPVAGGPNQEKVMVFDSHGLRPQAPAQ